MAVVRKLLSQVIARMESAEYPDAGSPVTGLVEGLSPSVWARLEESALRPQVGSALSSSDWSLIQTSHALGCACGRDIMTSVAWSAFISPFESDKGSARHVLHAVFAALSGIALDDCEIVELVPLEQLTMRVYGYWGLLVPGPDRNRRTAALVVRGLCSAVMELAYGEADDEQGRDGTGQYTCIQSRSVERGDPYDEFTAVRR